MRFVSALLAISAAAVGLVRPAFAQDAATRSHGTATASPLAALSQLFAERGASVRAGVSYGPERRHALDVYEPDANKQRRRPIVLFLYGGSWTSGDRNLYAFLGSALASRGYTTVIADYRLYPEVRFPVFVEDAARAYGWVARTLSDRGRRPIVVMGHSAGAHIAALVTLDPQYRSMLAPGAPSPAGLIGLAGPYAFDPTTWPTTREIFARVADNPDVARPTIAARRLNGRPPPALLLHGSGDTVVTPDASAALRDALASRGGSVRHIESGTGHLGIMLAFARPFRWKAGVLDATLTFLETVDSRSLRAAQDR